MIEIDWNGITMTSNNDKVELSKIIAIKIRRQN